MNFGLGVAVGVLVARVLLTRRAPKCLTTREQTEQEHDQERQDLLEQTKQLDRQLGLRPQTESVRLKRAALANAKRAVETAAPLSHESARWAVKAVRRWLQHKK